MLDAIFSWNTLWWMLMFIYVPACIGLIGIVLLQQGKGTGFGGAFGAGAGPGADTVFGPKGAQTMPVKLTYVGATIFMVVAIVMSLLAGRLNKGDAPELIDGVAEFTAIDGSNADIDGMGWGSGVVNPDAHNGAAAVPISVVIDSTEPTDAATDEEEATDEAPVSDESSTDDAAPIEDGPETDN
ncbi:MAG: preprotein translocase subunit SecG [Candidatus Hydrogenedentota bacterium]